MKPVAVRKAKSPVRGFCDEWGQRRLQTLEFV